MKTRNGSHGAWMRLALVSSLSLAPAAASPANDPSAVEPAAREGSGTGWLPASTPSAGQGMRRGPWDLMLHYNAFAGVSAQDAPENLAEGFTSNWVISWGRPWSGGTARPARFPGRFSSSFAPRAG